MGDPIKENEMGNVLGRRKIHTEVWWQNLKEQDHLEDLSIDGRTILKWTLKRDLGGHGLD